MITFNLAPREEFEAEFTSRGGTMKLRLKTPTTAERMNLAQAANMRLDTPDFAKMLKLIASDFWVSFSGAMDHDGVEIQNTKENRLALLQVSMDLMSFILGELRSEAEKAEEGKGASDSV